MGQKKKGKLKAEVTVIQLELFASDPELKEMISTAIEAQKPWIIISQEAFRSVLESFSVEFLR